jgi:two-component system NtrC family sensor kinase
VTGATRTAHRRFYEDYAELSRSILRLANQGVPRSDFAHEVLTSLVDFSEADEVQVRVNEPSRYYCASLKRSDPASFEFRMKARQAANGDEEADCEDDNPALRQICRTIIRGEAQPGSPWYTRNGSFWTGDTSEPFGAVRSETDENVRFAVGGDYRSLAVIRFAVGEDSHGLVLLWSHWRGFLSETDVGFYEGVAQTIGVALADRRAQAALRERVKELTCLYGIDQVREREDLSLPRTLQAIVELLPPAWLYPLIAHARISVDGIDYTTRGFGAGSQRLTADISVRGTIRGSVEVEYTEPRPILDEGPFLRDERRLIDAVASQVAAVLARRQAEEERQRFEEQLRHADRLATIGQLAAGVAHELNEPLSSVLGFAQLARKTPGLPGSAASDIDKTVTAALHARDVVSKLMLFARQKMPAQGQVQLNELVENGLLLLESRCAKAGIRVERRLDPALPAIAADSGQLLQVLVNLVVNALQATPAGGTITISTERAGDFVVLAVADTGTGMTPEVLKRVFIPFFTTKQIGEGTGLGLSVVHGIVTAHGGRIEVESELQKGSRFRVRLPIAGPAEDRKGGEP